METISRPAEGEGGARRGLFADLVASGRFCRDTPFGGMLHRGSTSLREIAPGESLHVCIDASDRVSVHVDRFSPVAGGRPDGTCRYTVGAVLAHLAVHVAAQLRRLVHGARGRHRCRLRCELVEAPGPRRRRPSRTPSSPPAGRSARRPRGSTRPSG